MCIHGALVGHPYIMQCVERCFPIPCVITESCHVNVFKSTQIQVSTSDHQAPTPSSQVIKRHRDAGRMGTQLPRALSAITRLMKAPHGLLNRSTLAPERPLLIRRLPRLFKPSMPMRTYRNTASNTPRGFLKQALFDIPYTQAHVAISLPRRPCLNIKSRARRNSQSIMDYP